MSEHEIKMGLMATLIGPLKIMGEDAVRGAKLALSEFGNAVNGCPIRLAVEGTNAIPQSAADAVLMLLQREQADFLVGPLSGNEGLAIRDFAKTVPNKTFLNGTAGSQDMTLRSPADNFFSFSTNGVQRMAGLGTYVYEKLGYKRVVTLAQDYSYPQSQVAGFMLEFCRAGGEVVEKLWVSLATSDFGPVISSIPGNIDAIFVALAGGDTVNFLHQFAKLGGNIPLIAGTSTVDQSVLGLKGTVAERAIGAATSGPISDHNPDPAWQSFVDAYRHMYPDGLPSPSLFAHGYYVNTMAALLALQAVDCDLSHGQAHFREALSYLEFETPTGTVRLDHNRQAIANMFVSTVEQDEDRSLYTRLVEEIPAVNQTLGFDEEEYLKLGPITADNPTCEQIVAISG